jgi:hypothetical protein
MAFNAWRKWLDRTFGRRRTPPIRRQIPLRLEQLEARWVPSISATGQAMSFSEGTAIPVVVATFTDTTPSPAADYTASINWGDSTSSTGAVSLSGTTYTVTGSHTYAEETPGSPHTVHVAIAETAGDLDTATATASATVADAPLRVEAGPGFSANEGAMAGPVVLGRRSPTPTPATTPPTSPRPSPGATGPLSTPVPAPFPTMPAPAPTRSRGATPTPRKAAISPPSASRTWAASPLTPAWASTAAAPS